MKEDFDPPPISQMRAWKAFLVPKLYHVVEFLTTQGIAMAARLLCGFLCVRLLAIPEYAKFAVVYGFLGTMSVLIDVSFTGTLIPLIGQRVGDRQLIADYVASLRQLTRRVYLLVAPCAVVLYPILVHKQPWSWRVVAAMVVILLVVSWCDRISGAYGAVLIVRRDRSTWYRAQMIASVGPLTLLGVLWALHGLNAFSAILTNVAGTIFLCSFFFLRARRLSGVAGRPSREKQREIIHLTLPNVPNLIFFAIQGQISLILITLFGHTTAVASVGALARLAQIFVLFGQMGPLLIQPYFAKLPAARLKRNYLGVLAVQGALCLFATGLARYFPQVFLWILGHKYSGLRYEVFLMIAGASIGYFSGMIGVIHWARKFIYWWSGMSTIVVTVAIQALFIWKVDLSTVRAVLVLNLTTAAAILLVGALTGIYGFVRGPRRMADVAPTLIEGDYV
jgi:O-antigen/teichoic acid export membrane protein